MAHTQALVVGFEGLPGCGKTTVIGLLLGALRAMGLQAIAVDIDTSAHASTLRAVADALPLDNFVRSMLFWAMRRHQYEIVQQMRERMDVILMDRTWGIALAADCYGNGISRIILDWAGQNLNPPAITFLFRVPLEVAHKRKASRTMRDLAFARRVAQGYAELARAHTWLCVDATRTPEEVRGHCLGIIRTALAEKACQV